MALSHDENEDDHCDEMNERNVRKTDLDSPTLRLTPNITQRTQL